MATTTSSSPPFCTMPARAPSAPAIASRTWWLAGSPLALIAAAQASQFEMRRALARSRAHSELGADLLLAAAAPPRAIELTRRHHRPAGRDAMLALLQRADAAT